MPDYPKVPQQISDPISENLAKLADLFPSVVKDGLLDIDALQAEFGEFKELQPGDEHYGLNWVGKQAAKKEAFKPLLGKTLALKGDGKNSEITQNLYIEGDNLEALKLLRQNYYGEVTMMYIDPPYNTGKDFVYKDNFTTKSEESEQEEGAVSKDGQRLIKNERTSNRFHARWLDMLYPRIKLAKELLAEDGVIFISIDDTEMANIRSIADQIFGENNRLDRGAAVWKSACSPRGFNHVVKDHEYILCYAKNLEKIDYKDIITPDLEPFDGQLWIARTKANPVAKVTFPAGIRCEGGDRVVQGSIGSGRTRIDIIGNLVVKNNKLVEPVTLEASWPSKNQLLEFLQKSEEEEVYDTKEQKWLEVYFTASNFPIVTKERGRLAMRSVIDDCGNTGTPDVKKLNIPADFPKPVNLIKKLLANFSGRKSIVMDFFSGSATTAHAVLQLNAEDGGNRSFIMVQLPEICAEDSEAAKAGYTTIAEIGKERIRRAGEKIKEELKAKHAEWKKQQQLDFQKGSKLELDDEATEVTNPYISNPEALDIGFKSFHIEDTKINWLKKDLRGEQLEFSDTTTQDALDFVPGYTDTDVVYELMLRQSNIPLTGSITKPIATAKRTYLYADAYLICLEEKITEKLVQSLAAIEPTPNKYFFRDSAFGTDIALKDETFRRLKAEIHKNHGDLGAAYTVEFI